MKEVVSKLVDEILEAINKFDGQVRLSEIIQELSARQESVSTKVKVVSAQELNGVEREKIEKVLEIDQIEYQIDPSILGGLIVEKNGKRQDLSLRRRLNAVKKVISE